MAKEREKRNIDINLDEADEGLIESVGYEGYGGGGDHHIITVKLVGAFFHCTACGRLRPASKFGLRQTDDGIVRNQAQCKSCR